MSGLSLRLCCVWDVALITCYFEGLLILTAYEFLYLISSSALVVGLVLTFNEYHLQHVWNRKENALSYSTLYHPELQLMKVELHDKLSILGGNETIPLKDIKQKLTPDLLIKLYSVLDYYEDMSLAYFHNIADGDVLFDLIGPPLISYRNQLKDFIEDQRTTRNMKDLWIKMENLSVLWQQKIDRNMLCKPAE